MLRKGSTDVTVECFEVSPDAGSVIACHGSLIRRFPAHAVSLPFTVFRDSKFQRELALRLSQLDAEMIPEMIPQSMKAGKSNDEVRDTVHPGLVTVMLMAMLAPLGTAVKVHQISKRIRDDVLWDNCMYPWRRSSLWLSIRVALQSTLSAMLSREHSTIEYKNFLILVLVEIGSKALTLDIPDDICRVIVAKIARRASKLGKDLSNLVQDRALRICQDISSELKSRWQAVQKQDAERPTTIERRDFEQDTILVLSSSKQYLDTVLNSDHLPLQIEAAFVPHGATWLGWYCGLPNLDNLPGMAKDETVQALTEFEDWVRQLLPAWIEQRLTSAFCDTSRARGCMALATVAVVYRDKALPIYDNIPEQISNMYLTIAELWYAMDLLAVEAIPLLGNFSSSLPSNLFDPLLLPKKNQLQRLRVIELHITDRETTAKRENPSIFADPVHDSFAAQYVASSSHHRGLRKQIEEDAHSEREEKKIEWRAASEKYRELTNEAKAKSCATKMDDYDNSVHDNEHCKKCALNREADAMRIEVHEWPLPNDEKDCACAIFELDCPLEFAAWRNLTWLLVHDLGREGQGTSVSPLAHLPRYPALSMYYRPKDSRLTLASKTKPFIKAHYQELKFPVTAVENCFVPNALRFHLFDATEGMWVQEQVKTPSLHERCVTKLPSGPYSNLQYGVDSVNHSQNQVIADQDSCSKDLSLHEFLSFGSLRSDGERIQWFNICRELSACNLNLNTEAVCILITQAAWQAGSQGDTIYRNSHTDLACPQFCKELLTTTAKTLDTIRANWKSDNAMLMLISIILRVLSLCTTPDVCDTALELLKVARAVVHDWSETLGSLLYAAVDGTEISKIQQRLLKISIISKMTYDVDDDYVAAAASAIDDVRIWIISSIRVRENIPGTLGSLPRDLRRLLLRDIRITYSRSQFFRELIGTEKNPGLDGAIRQVWSGYERGVEFWTTLQSPNDRWLKTQTAASSDRKAQTVHYNLLDGELLVDGRPLGRLPMEYVRSDIYQWIFGSQVLQVCSADVIGMLYMSVQNFYGYVVYFGKRGGNVVIRTTKDSHTLELLPKQIFSGDLPEALVSEHFHWLDLASREIVFRPMNQRWISDPCNWRLQYLSALNPSISDGKRTLIDMKSITCSAVLGVFGALESLDNVLVTISSNGRLEVALTRYDLRFFFNADGHFECYELGRIVDPNQTVGTMVGLKNRLVLCGTQPLARKHDRVLLVPEGRVSVHARGSHTEVQITTMGSKIRLFRYQIDATLRRLQEDGDIISILYKAYLHAVTSHTLPDPFSERTGTEEAISYLRQRSLRLTRPPGPEVIALLESISTLTPARQFYPTHKRVMQRVEWHSTLSMLAQHDEFLPLAEQILSSGNPYTIFYPKSQKTESLRKNSDADLLERAKYRNSCFRNSDFGGSYESRNRDCSYVGRDRCAELIRGSRSYNIAKLIRDWPQSFNVSKSIVRDLWSDCMSSSLSSLGGARFDTSKTLSDLLMVHMSSSWGPLLELCRACTRANDTYRLLFLFAIIAYGKGFSSSLLQTLLAFAFVPELRTITPTDAKYTTVLPANGSVLDSRTLRDTISSQMKKYDGPTKRYNKAAYLEALAKYQNQCKRQTEAVLRHYINQWPTDTPTDPASALAPNIYYDYTVKTVKQLFFAWTANREYEDYLNRVQLVLNDIYQDSDVTEYTAVEWHQAEARPEFQWIGAHPPSLGSIIHGDSPKVPPKTSPFRIQRGRRPTDRNERLRRLIADIHSNEGASSHHVVRSQYREDLLASYDAFSAHQEPVSPQYLPCPINELVLHRMICEHDLNTIFENIREQLKSTNDYSMKLLESGGLWPQMTLRNMLSFLSSTSTKQLNDSWLAYLLILGKAVTNLQRARRLVLAAEKNDVSGVSVELENEGHSGWEIGRQPDWLLIEIENDFLIRPMQAQVALEMIQPSSFSNSLVQLNMGA